MKENKGFGLVPIIAMVAVIAIAGLVVWRVYDTNKNNSSNQTTNSTNQSSSNNQTTTPTDTSTYLDIKELGVKIKLSEDIKDAVYYYDGNARVSTTSLIKKSNGSCDPASSAPFGNLMKTNSVNQPNGSVLKANGVNVFQFGDEYVVYTTPTSACTVDDETVNLQTSQLQSFKEAVKTIQSDK